MRFEVRGSRFYSPPLLVPLSPCLLVSPSPCPLVSPSPKTGHWTLVTVNDSVAVLEGSATLYDRSANFDNQQREVGQF